MNSTALKALGRGALRRSLLGTCLCGVLIGASIAAADSDPREFHTAVIYSRRWALSTGPRIGVEEIRQRAPYRLTIADKALVGMLLRMIDFSRFEASGGPTDVVFLIDVEGYGRRNLVLYGDLERIWAGGLGSQPLTSELSGYLRGLSIYPHFVASTSAEQRVHPYDNRDPGEVVFRTLVDDLCAASRERSGAEANVCALAEYMESGDTDRVLSSLDLSTQAQSGMSELDSSLNRGCASRAGCVRPFGAPSLNDAVISTLASIAKSGKVDGLVRLFDYQVNSDGVYAESAAERLAELFASQPALIVQAWSKLGPFSQKVNLSLVGPPTILTELTSTYEDEFERQGRPRELAAELVASFYPEQPDQ